MVLKCAVCELEFEAQRSSAKYCTATCRQRAARSRRIKKKQDQSLVGSVRLEVEKAGKGDTFAGQLAIQLARQIVTPGATGVASLAKELRSVMAGLNGVDGVEPKQPVRDEVAEMKERREQKAREAASRA